MSRAIKWKVPFKTIKERSAEINIYEDDYTGDPIILEPASNAFTTEEDSSDDILQPIRSYTGYIRVIDNGNLGGLMPVNNTQHYIELFVDGILEWCGYMQADTFSEDWNITPVEAEFPIISGLGIIDGKYMDQTKDMNVVNFASIIEECLLATGIDYETIYLPKEVTRSNAMADYNLPLLAMVSRYNFFSESNSLNYDDPDYMEYDADTYRSVLEEFCKFWGWCMRERGKTVYFISTSVDNYVVISRSNLREMATGSTSIPDNTVTITLKDIVGMELAGDNHKRDVIQGCNKMYISANVNEVGNVVPELSEDDFEKLDEKTYIYKPIDSGVVLGYNKVINYEYIGRNAEFYLWEKISDNWVISNFGQLMWDIRIGARFIEHDNYSYSELDTKKNYNYKKAIAITRTLLDGYYSYPPADMLRNMILFRERSKAMAFYDSGAFVISSSVYGTESIVGQPIQGIEKEEIEMMFRIGNKYWNGTGWNDWECWFNVEIGYEGTSTGGTGKIISTKTLSMPYNGADGYIIPIKERVAGVAELSIHALNGENKNRIMYFSNLKVDYYKVDGTTESKRDGNIYSIILENGFKNDKQIELNFATDNNNPAAYSIITHTDVDMASLFFSRWGQMRPEMALLSNLKRLYGRTTEKLTLEMEKADITPLTRLTRDGKTYVVLSESVDWSEETVNYMIEDLPV